MPEHDLSASAFLKEQLAVTRATWARLRKHGVVNGSELQLDFYYAAPTSAHATELMHFLQEETDYEMHVTAHEDHWLLAGQTKRTAVSLRIVEQWVDWMLAAGLRFGCVFDGWGAEAT